MLSKEEILKKRAKARNKSEPKEKDRSGRVILILLLISSGLALTLYLSNLLPGIWQKMFVPKVIRPQDPVLVSPTIIESAPTPWQQSLKEDLTSFVSQKDGFYGIYLYQIEDSQFIGVNHQETFSGASLMKLPVIITAYWRSERQLFDLTGEYRLREEDKLAGNGSVYLQPEGTIYTYRNLAKLAIEQSDNTANSVIAKSLGEEKIQQVIDFLGLEKTNYSDYQTSPENIGRLLVGLHQGEFLTAVHSQEIIGYLTQTIFNDQIPAALPEDIIVAHKIGFDDQILHDAAIIFTDNGDFVLVIMSRGVSNDQAQENLEIITQRVWEIISLR